MCEEGYAFPGTMTVASDSHSNMYGGLGCLGTPIVRSDAASVWATGKVSLCFPYSPLPHVSGEMVHRYSDISIHKAKADSRDRH